MSPGEFFKKRCFGVEWRGELEPPLSHPLASQDSREYVDDDLVCKANVLCIKLVVLVLACPYSSDAPPPPVEDLNFD